jgi:Tannase-like family of unknown function (DUF6351)
MVPLRPGGRDSFIVLGVGVLRGAGVVLLAMLALASGADAAQAPRIKVLSNRADLISAGDALVQVKLPAGTNPSKVRVHVGQKNVTSLFALRPDGRYEGYLTGLVNGPNVVTARVLGGRGARLTILNHPNGGPVLAGPQVQPWTCQETAIDTQCNQPTLYAFKYKSSVTGQFQDYDPKSPPADLATTTTDQGKTVPYIVRLETGYQDRDQFSTAVLYDPAKPFRPWEPQAGWNHKLLITHGASCGIERTTGDAPDVMNDAALSHGFAVMSTALDNAGHNCNIATQAESLIMAKEHVIEEYGRIRYTIATGCSGGSLVQQQVANAYPGLYQGLLPQCSFPDSWSTGQQLAANHLTRLYFENPTKWGPGIAWTPDAIANVEGHPNHADSVIFDTVYWTDLAIPDDTCVGVKPEQTYNRDTNPNGVRCTLTDYMINVMGPRRKSVWSPMEKKVGHGFGGIPLDNVGVQFGLRALRRNQITPAQFVDLNEKIGGVDIDIRPVARRNVADEPALRNVYRNGAINEANNLQDVPIIDLRGPDPGAFHDTYRSWTMRARLEHVEKHFPKNHVIWFGHVPLLGDANYATEGLYAIDRWLAKVEADKRHISRERKVAEDRPKDIQDKCSQYPGVEAVNVPGVGKVCQNENVQTRFTTPAMVAGEGVRTDTNKCRLKPLRREDYYPIEFTEDEWTRMKKVFSTGVCNWSKTGVDQRYTIPWMSYQHVDGSVAYGGRPLGKPPHSTPLPKK